MSGMCKEIIFFQKVFIITSLLIMFLSLYMTSVEINYEYELRAVEFGFPLHFLTQNSTMDPPLPYVINFSNMRETPTKINFTNFFLSLLILQSIFNIFYFTIRALIKVFSHKSING